MSMHKIPLTPLEEEGLLAHALPIGKPSQLSDCFRQGVAWGAPKWQPIETAPEGRLLLYGLYDGEPHMAVGDVTTKWVYWFVPTHWMPLPAPPSTQR